MENLHCPQCDIQRFHIKNELNECLVVTVNAYNEIVPVNSDDSLFGFDVSTIYCLGCSWKGSPKSLTNGSHK